MSTVRPKLKILNLSLDRGLLVPGKTDTEQRFRNYSHFFDLMQVLIPADKNSVRIINPKITITAVSGILPVKALRLVVVGTGICKKKGINLITANDPALGFLGWLVRVFSPGTKLNINVLGLEMTNPLWQRENWPIHKLIGLLQLFVLDRTDSIRSDSRAAKKELTTLGISPDKIFFVPLIPSKKVLAHLKKSPLSLGEKPRFDLLCVADFIPQKGHELLLSAFAIVTKVHPNIKLALVGDGPSKSKLQRLVQALRETQNVKFLGRVGYAVLPHYYRRSKMLVVSSHYEGGPRVAMEAALCGTPIVSTNVGSISDMLTDGYSAHVVVPGDANALAQKIIDLLDSPEKRKLFSTRAKRQMEKYSDPETNLKKTFQMWLQTLNSQ